MITYYIKVYQYIHSKEYFSTHPLRLPESSTIYESPAFKYIKTMRVKL